MSEAEKRLLEVRTDQMYETFLSRVSEGRGMPIPAVDSIAQGRVWVGTTAQEIGLVDKLGDLDAAVSEAAGLASLDDYHTVQYPRPKKPWERFLEDLLDQEIDFGDMVVKHQMGDLYPYYEQVHDMATAKGPQMRLPVMVEFK